jgi:hypothetical protein
MEKKAAARLKKAYQEELEDSFDTSWLSSSIQSPALCRPKLDLSYLLSQHSLSSSKASVSFSQSLDEFSFFRSEQATPRVVRASHAVKVPHTSRPITSQACKKSQPRVVTLRKRTVPENLLLDALPKRNKY